ncbi:hypothetical protein [Glaciimonas soli]|uniref:Uncharacterized protein n=1 Tax=Glaciimonas soli TaxID=2590999 RepID=A0A843YLY0_9BURK|nr:hypothetical protein [Glaciimonas soli]MQR00455.1 hypothetical protein [Glaciimonas soli]
MSTTIKHRRTNIVTLESGEEIAQHCRPGDTAIVHDEHGWWVHFIDEDGQVEGYDAPFESHNKALWTAKAAAEFAGE